MQAGHLFLKSLGKTKLRPGGKDATNWILQEANITKDSKVLEVACNMGTTMFHINKTYNCDITGVDLDANSIKEVNEIIYKNELNNVTAIVANAFELPFKDNSFDIIINEAMLTMLNYDSKVKALKEYNRVLKSGGILLTHDIAITENTTNKELSEGANVPGNALKKDKWLELFASNDFEITNHYNDNMTLMSPTGLIKDEGLFGALKIAKNGLKKENKKQFTQMFKYFKKNKDNLNYIVINAKKG